MIDYPVTLRENLLYRANLIDKAQKDVETQALINERCKRGLDGMFYWINCFVWTENPKKSGNTIQPFICYDFQYPAMTEIYYSILEGFDLLFEKTREMGASWMPIIVYTWFWKYMTGYSFKTGSWKENYVDKIDDMDSHFEKIRFLIKRLPSWMQPTYEAPFMKIANKDNGNVIVGETANKNFGSGGRKSSMLMDEFSKWDDSQSEGGWTSTADVTKSRIVVATPYGSANKYARLAKGEEGNCKIVTLHWSLHPEKAEGCYFLEENGDKTPLKHGTEAFEKWKTVRGVKAPKPLKGGLVRSPWYDGECERREEWDIAQELDCDYSASGYCLFDNHGMQKQRRLKRDPIAIGNVYRDGYNEISFREEPTGIIRLYEYPEPGEVYLLTADASKARGIDEASAYVGNIRLNQTVAVISGMHDEEDLGDACALLAEWYNNAIAAPENSCGYGNALTKRIYSQYNNIYLVPERQGKKDIMPQDYGFLTTSKSRNEMLSYHCEEIKNGSKRLYDIPTIDQHGTFVINPKNMKAEAAHGKQDGLVICAAIFTYIRKTMDYVKIANRRERNRNNPRPEIKMNAGITYGRR